MDDFPISPLLLKEGGGGPNDCNLSDGDGSDSIDEIGSAFDRNKQKKVGKDGKIKRTLTLSEIIKNRGMGTEKYSNYNDMIDEVYMRERGKVVINLRQLEHLIKTKPELFELSFKRSLLNHIKEIQRKFEEDVENKLREEQRAKVEERWKRIKKLKAIQEKYNIHLKKTVTESGEEIICLDIPFEQKMRNECNDYHYFF